MAGLGWHAMWEGIFRFKLWEEEHEINTIHFKDIVYDTSSFKTYPFLYYFLCLHMVFSVKKYKWHGVNTDPT